MLLLLKMVNEVAGFCLIVYRLMGPGCQRSILDLVGIVGSLFRSFLDLGFIPIAQFA